MQTGRRALLVRNPSARRGGEDIAAILARLEEGGVSVTEAPEDAGARKAAAAASDLVIVAGGDGTMHHAARFLLETGKPLGVLPMGTANDLARSLCVPPEPLEAAEIIIAGHTRRIDLGLVNDEPFFNVASMGVSVDLARELTKETKQRFGTFGYAVAGMRALMKARRFRATIENDRGQARRTRTFQIAVGNGRYYGGGMSVDQRCEIGDGRLYLYSLEMRSLWRLGLMAFDFRSGAHGAWEDVRSDMGERFVVTTRWPRDINADGEIVARTPATFRLQRDAIEVFAPPAGSQPE
jgi:YegS/Rv2252/BmrU family lipid kinase